MLLVRLKYGGKMVEVNLILPFCESGCRLRIRGALTDTWPIPVWIYVLAGSRYGQPFGCPYHRLSPCIDTKKD